MIGPNALKFRRRVPIPGNGMAQFARILFTRIRFTRLLVMAFFLACLGSAHAAKKNSKAAIPLVTAAPRPAPKAALKAAESAPAAASPQSAPAESAPANPATAFQELNFNRTLVIEGKVEKPAVQFTLLKEPPPEKEIRFETSFLQNILKLDRENTFKAGESYGRE